LKKQGAERESGGERNRKGQVRDRKETVTREKGTLPLPMVKQICKPSARFSREERDNGPKIGFFRKQRGGKKGSVKDVTPVSKADLHQKGGET